MQVQKCVMNLLTLYTASHTFLNCAGQRKIRGLTEKETHCEHKRPVVVEYYPYNYTYSTPSFPQCVFLYTTEAIDPAPALNQITWQINTV